MEIKWNNWSLQHLRAKVVRMQELGVRGSFWVARHDVKAVCHNIALVIVMFLMSGCATILNWDAHQKVPVRADTDGVRVTVMKSGERVEEFVAPWDVQLGAAHYGFCPARYEFVFEKEGYKTQRLYRDGRFCGWYIGNILFGGLIGLLIVDPLSGSMYKIDGYPIDAHMQKLDEDSSHVVGSEPVLFTVITLNYDESTHKGMIKVGYPKEAYEGARKFARKNIETIAKDKNVALKTGVAPAAALYYIGKEVVVSPGVLEVYFEVE